MIPSKGGGVPAMHKYLKKPLSTLRVGGWEMANCSESSSCGKEDSNLASSA